MSSPDKVIAITTDGNEAYLTAPQYDVNCVSRKALQQCDIKSVELLERAEMLFKTGDGNSCEDCPDCNLNPPSSSDCPHFNSSSPKAPFCEKEGSTQRQIDRWLS